MVRHEPTMDLVKCELRQHVCVQCHWRPRGSEALPFDAPRACEAGCSVFHHLPELARTTRLLDPMLRPTRATLRHRILSLCRDDPRGTCPLNEYREQVVAIVADAFGK